MTLLYMKARELYEQDAKSSLEKKSAVASYGKSRRRIRYSFKKNRRG
ncbi:hypothetical protein JOC86_002269 [Bacillus pakistanensis]|uniref:Uncharacterized protein n=1 Tax=Rossellomorea pakistanensis TaxID=992288 RepID=A0ABS2NCY4_9BACI|nr:hypothetical protein [Bacillus pakistanensis]MBM7585727.1 hypothetical protein [Bacillus pakistanensis]